MTQTFTGWYDVILNMSVGTTGDGGGYSFVRITMVNM